MSFTSDLDLQFWVVTIDGTQELACELLLNAVLYKGSLAVNGLDILMHINTIYVDKIKVVSDTFGPLSALTLKVELNNGFRIGIPFINHKLQNYPFAVPNNIGGIFLLSDLTISYFNNYLLLGMTPTFLPPATAVSKLLNMIQ